MVWVDFPPPSVQLSGNCVASYDRNTNSLTVYPGSIYDRSFRSFRLNHWLAEQDARW